MTRKLLFVLGMGLLLIAAALIVSDTGSPAPVSAQDEECPQGYPCPDWIVQAWMGSGHAAADTEPFTHWDEEDPKEVPANCAKCHSETGYLDFLGVDGSVAGSVEANVPVGTVVTCTACHNPATVTKETVVFPSGVELNVGSSARCMECHQGRASGVGVAEALAGQEPDTANPELRFTNIHYFAAAASLYGSQAMGGFQYEGQAYQPMVAHVPEYNTCAECHNPHSLELKIEECATCHTGVASAEDLKAVRMPSSMVDYDGDGNVDEGMYEELEGLQAALYADIQAYAREVAGTPILYNAAAYPYFFGDVDDSGAVDGEEAGYAAWTPRLLQAAYNYQFYEKDPGAFAHNPRYHAQLMFDSLASLNEALAAPVDMTMLHRNPPGHFDGSGEPFRHWDEDGEVSASCVKCHTAEGLPMFVHNNATIAVEPSVSLACTTCHTSLPEFTLYELAEVTFPSGAKATFGENVPANLCLNCHQGRESTTSVNTAINRAGVGDDEVAEGLTFRNVHYFAAGATLFGGEAMGGYQYEGKEYVGRNLHVPGMAETCTDCHNAHTLAPDINFCSGCHQGITELHDIRMASGDFDGDAAEEGVAGEIVTFQEALLPVIQAYALNTTGVAIVYNPARHPYWFIDASGNGALDPEDTERFVTWTPRLLRAAYNYQYSQKDPGAFAHNPKYVVQLLFDSLEDIGGAEAVAGLTRP
jgi:hypothetical protein